MSFSFDLYIEKKSWLHKLDPRAKLLFAFALIVVALSFQNLWMIIACLLGLHVMLLSGRVPWSRIAWVWKMMLPITILIPVMWPLFYHEGSVVLLQFWHIKVTTYSLLMGIAMALRINVLGLACFAVLFTTDQARIVRAIVKLGIPFEWGLILAIALRYLPTFYGIMNMIREAQQARGLDLSRGSFSRRLKSYLPILVAVVITALRTSDNLSHALETRAFGAKTGPRTYFRDLNPRPGDLVFSIGVVVVTAGILFARFKYGLGASLYGFPG